MSSDLDLSSLPAEAMVIIVGFLPPPYYFRMRRFLRRDPEAFAPCISAALLHDGSLRTQLLRDETHNKEHAIRPLMTRGCQDLLEREAVVGRRYMLPDRMECPQQMVRLNELLLRPVICEGFFVAAIASQPSGWETIVFHPLGHDKLGLRHDPSAVELRSIFVTESLFGYAGAENIYLIYFDQAANLTLDENRSTDREHLRFYAEVGTVNLAVAGRGTTLAILIEKPGNQYTIHVFDCAQSSANRIAHMEPEVLSEIEEGQVSVQKGIYMGEHNGETKIWLFCDGRVDRTHTQKLTVMRFSLDGTLEKTLTATYTPFTCCRIEEIGNIQVNATGIEDRWHLDIDCECAHKSHHVIVQDVGNRLVVRASPKHIAVWKADMFHIGPTSLQDERAAFDMDDFHGVLSQAQHHARKAIEQAGRDQARSLRDLRQWHSDLVVNDSVISSWRTRDESTWVYRSLLFDIEACNSRSALW